MATPFVKVLLQNKRVFNNRKCEVIHTLPLGGVMTVCVGMVRWLSFSWQTLMSVLALGGAEVWSKNPSLPFPEVAKSLMCISGNCCNGQKCLEISEACSSQGLSIPAHLKDFSPWTGTAASRPEEGGTGFNCHNVSCVKYQYFYLMLVAFPPNNSKYIGNCYW